MRKNPVFIVIITSLLFASCDNAVRNETAYDFPNGNKIVYEWNVFNDATVFYENASGVRAELFNYYYADSNERMEIIKGTSDGTAVAFLVRAEPATKRFPSGTGLFVFKMDLSSGVTVLKSITVTEEKVIGITEATGDAVTYTTESGNSTKNFDE